MTPFVYYHTHYIFQMANIFENINVLFDKLESDILQNTPIQDIYEEIKTIRWSIVSLFHMKHTSDKNAISQLLPFHVNLSDLNASLCEIE